MIIKIDPCYILLFHSASNFFLTIVYAINNRYICHKIINHASKIIPFNRYLFVCVCNKLFANTKYRDECYLFEFELGF